MECRDAEQHYGENHKLRWRNGEHGLRPSGILGTHAPDGIYDRGAALLDFFEPDACPCELEAENTQTYGDHHDRGTGKHDHRDANSKHRETNDGNGDAPRPLIWGP